MTNRQLSSFLVAAKRATYASVGEVGERTLPDGAKELVYEAGLFRYRDRYFGSNPFLGEEIVFHKSKPVWGMNYCGLVVSVRVESNDVYEFLRLCLQEVTVSKPFRGPRSLTRDDWKYRCSAQGNVEKFSGHEAILHRNRKVYDLLFHGGRIA